MPRGPKLPDNVIPFPGPRARRPEPRDRVAPALPDDLFDDEPEARERPLPATPTLIALLRFLPVRALNAVATRHGVPVGGRRADRERALVERITPELAGELEGEPLALLEWLYGRGGGAPLSVFPRGYGADEEQRPFWLPPGTPLGELRRAGLVFVGTPPQSAGRVAVIPVDLLPGLRKRFDR